MKSLAKRYSRPGSSPGFSARRVAGPPTDATLSVVTYSVDKLHEERLTGAAALEVRPSPPDQVTTQIQPLRRSRLCRTQARESR
jgi:hypothetical protein